MAGTKTDVPGRRAKRESEKEPMVRRQVLLPDSLYDKCAELGQSSDVSASAIIRYAVRDYLARRGMTKTGK